MRTFKLQLVTVASTTVVLWVSQLRWPATTTLVAAIVSTVALVILVTTGVLYVRRVMRHDA